MEALRRARRLACLVLAWFALSAGLAMAAPTVQGAAGDDSICSSASPHSQQGGAPQGGHTHDCVLCSLVAGPPAALAIPQIGPLPTRQPAAVLPEPAVAQDVTPFLSRAPPVI